jgi:hypothetical protein
LKIILLGSLSSGVGDQLKSFKFYCIYTVD